MSFPVVFFEPNLRTLKRDIPRIWTQVERLEWTISSLVYSKSREWSASLYYSYFPELLSDLNMPTDEKIFKKTLDYGTGNGHLLLLLEDYSEKIVAVDVNPSMLKVAHKIANKHGPKNVKFKQIQPDKIPSKKNSFDCVLAVAVLPYVFSDDKTIKELVRVLKPGGALFFTDASRHIKQFDQTKEKTQKKLESLGIENIHHKQMEGTLNSDYTEIMWYGLKKK